MSGFDYGLSVIAPTRAAGNALAASFSDHAGDAQAFDHALPLYAPGTTFTPLPVPRPSGLPTASSEPVAFFLYAPITAEKYQQALAIYDSVIAAGYRVDIGPREQIEARWSQFIADNGYVTP